MVTNKTLRERVAAFKQHLETSEFVRNISLEHFNLHWSVAYEIGAGRDPFQPIDTARNPIMRLIREVGVVNGGKYQLDYTEKGLSIRVRSDWNEADYAKFMQLLAEHGYEAELTDRNRIVVKNA